MRSLADTALTLSQLLYERARPLMQQHTLPAEDLLACLTRLGRNLCALAERFRGGETPSHACKLIDADLERLFDAVTKRRMLPGADVVRMQCLRDRMAYEDGTVFAVLARNPLLLVDPLVNGTTGTRRSREVERVRWLGAARRKQLERKSVDPFLFELQKLDKAGQHLLELARFLYAHSDRRAQSVAR